MNIHIACEERRQRQRFQKRIDIALRGAPDIANWGDGNAGYLIHEFIQACVKYGYYREPQRDERQKVKIPRTLAKQVFERDEYRCRACKTHVDLTVDHVHPESKGGATSFDNLQTLCKPCNSRKGTKVA